MIRWLVVRGLQAAVTLVLVTVLLFFLMRLAPGDPLSRLGSDQQLSPRQLQHIRALYRLDQPPGKQLAAWVAGLAHGDLGNSIEYGRPVTSLIAERLPATLLLGGKLIEGAVVGPADAASIARALATPTPSERLTVVINPEPAGDMLSSVRCGLRSLPRECDAALVALGDQPSITRALVSQMLNAFRAAGRGIVVPLYAGKRGHPIVFSLRYRDEVLTRYDDVGLRGLLAAHPQDVFELDVADSWVLSDMDYPEDYSRELGAIERG